MEPWTTANPIGGMDYLAAKDQIKVHTSPMHRNKIKKDRKVFAVLGQREKFEKYFKFIKRIFKVKVYNKDSLGKIYIEFL